MRIATLCLLWSRGTTAWVGRSSRSFSRLQRLSSLPTLEQVGRVAFGVLSLCHPPRAHILKALQRSLHEAGWTL